MNTIPDPSPEDEEGLRYLALRWASGDLNTQYVNHLMITFTETEFYLTFGEVIPPAVANEMELGELPDSIEIKPVVRLAMSPGAMLKIADTINKNVEKYVRRISTFGEGI